MSRPKPTPLAKWKKQAIREKINDPNYINSAIEKLANELSDIYVKQEAVKARNEVYKNG